jgi:hypothetical protein
VEDLEEGGGKRGMNQTQRYLDFLKITTATKDINNQLINNQAILVEGKRGRLKE